MYLIEIGTGTANSLEGDRFYLWSERCVAGILTLEYFIRWTQNKRYPLTVFGAIDLLAIFPFWIGFFVPPEWLGMVRTLRVMRLLKFFRYHRGLQFVALAFYRSMMQLRALSVPILIGIIFSTVAMYEAEHLAQPETFKNIFSTLWFTLVTITTVGYGDMSPVTHMGKIIAMVTFIPVLSLFAGIIGVLGSAFTKVIEEEADPANDPLEMFKEVRVSQSNN
jgi:voltage-gated potassium channel